VSLQFFQGNEFDSGAVGCLQINGRGTIVFERGFPARDAHAPLVTWFQTGKSPFRARRDQVVSVESGEVKKFLRHLYANSVLPNILRPGTTVAVAIKSGQRLSTTTLQFGAEDVCGHGGRIIERACLSSPAKVEGSGGSYLKITHRILRLSLGMTAVWSVRTKAHAIAYWLLPETAAREVFAKKIREFARRFETPVFAPHVSVFVAPENSRHPAEILRELGAVTLELTIHSIRFSEQFTKTLFVQFEPSVRLQELGDRIWKATRAPEQYVIDPHISLLYARLVAEKKKALVDEISFPFRTVGFSSICAMRCARPTVTAVEVEQWRLLASQE
jgi:hypothetical protein